MPGELLSNSFNSTSIKNIVFGSPTQRVDAIRFNSTANEAFSAALQSIVIYVTENVDQGLLSTRL